MHVTIITNAAARSSIGSAFDGNHKLRCSRRLATREGKSVEIPLGFIRLVSNPLWFRQLINTT